jgi:Co/Zn/Cd efflux system component
MQDHDDGHGHSNPTSENSLAWRRILWFAFNVNAAMFFVEMWAGIASGSSSLQANALDFFGDAVNYAISLSVFSMAVAWQTRAAIFKGVSLILLGLWALGATFWNVYVGTLPEVHTMGIIGVVGLVANVLVAVMLYRFRNGDANMRSVWLCTRNDAVGNIAVLLAAVGVFGTATGWPDFVVAIVLAYLGLSAGGQTLTQALNEDREHRDGR